MSQMQTKTKTIHPENSGMSLKDGEMIEYFQIKEVYKTYWCEHLAEATQTAGNMENEI